MSGTVVPSASPAATRLPEPGVAAVVDELLTSGAHFRAAKRVLTWRFAGIEVVGLFLARRVPATTAPEVAAR